MATDTTTKTPLEHAEACWERIRPASPVYAFFLADVTLVSASDGQLTARLTVAPKHVNSKGTLHGSVSATLVDWAGGLAIATTGLERTGLSTDLHVSYLGPARLGDVLTVEGRLGRLGRNMAFTTVDIVRGDGDDRSVVAHGTHTKYVLRDQEAAKNKG